MAVWLPAWLAGQVAGWPGWLAGYLAGYQATWLARPGDLPWLTRVAGWLSRWLARVAQSASVASQAQPAKRGRWMGSQSALHPAIDPCVDYMDPRIDLVEPLIN